MNIDYLLKIDGYVVPNVTKCKAYRNDTDDAATGRSASEGLIRYRVARIPKIEVEIGISYQEEMQKTLKKLAPASFTVEWFDPETGTYRNGTFYAGPHFPEFISKKPLVYAPMAFNLIAYEGDEGNV